MSAIEYNRISRLFFFGLTLHPFSCYYTMFRKKWESILDTSPVDSYAMILAPKLSAS